MIIKRNDPELDLLEEASKRLGVDIYNITLLPRISKTRKCRVDLLIINGVMEYQRGFIRGKFVDFTGTQEVI